MIPCMRMPQALWSVAFVLFPSDGLTYTGLPFICVCFDMMKDPIFFPHILLLYRFVLAAL